MTVLFVTPEGKKVVYEEDTGPSSYVPPGHSIRVKDVNIVERVIFADIGSGYVTGPQKCTFSGNYVTVPIFYLPDPTTYSGTTSPLREVASGADLSAMKIGLVVLGSP